MFVLENHVSFKVSPSEFELSCSDRKGYSASMGLKIAQPDMLQILVEITNAMFAFNKIDGLSFDSKKPNQQGFHFQTAFEDGSFFYPIRTAGRVTKYGFTKELKRDEPLTIDGGVNFNNGTSFKVGAPDCYHIWRATFFPRNYPMQPGGLMGIINYCEGVAVADDGVVLPIDG